MKKKTPLQQLINDWEDFCNKEANHLFNTIASIFISDAKKRLEEEKEQLIQAVCIEELITTREDAEKWFELTYESND